MSGIGHDSEENVQLWKESLEASMPPGPDGSININLGNAVDTIAMIDSLAAALRRYFADERQMPDTNVQWHLREIEDHAGDLYDYLTDEG